MAAPAGVGLVRWTAPAAVFVIALLVFLRTLLPGQAFDDWGEMQVVPHVLGIPHPTGYPTYVLAAWLFELLPFGSVAFRANLFAAVDVAFALAMVTSIAQRLGVRPVVAAGAAIATGATGTIWASAVVAEVNALHLAFIALILERSLAWAQHRRFRDLALGGLLIGLSMGNHVLTAFVAPYAILFVLWAGRDQFRANPRWLMAPVATMALGAAVYLYLPIAASLQPPLPYNGPTTPEAFLYLVTGMQFSGQYGGLFTPEGPVRLATSMPALWELALARANALVPLLAALGFLVLLRRHRAFALVLGATILTGAYIWANYLRLEHYLLVAWMACGVLVAVALDGLARVLAALLRGRARPLPTVVAGAAGVALAAMLVVTNLPAADMSHERGADDFSSALFAALPANAALLSFWGPSPALWYAQLVDGKRPDVLIVDDTNIVYEGWGTREARLASLICTRPVYALRSSGQDLVTMQADYTTTEVGRFMVGALGPTAEYEIPLWLVQPRAGCP